MEESCLDTAVADVAVGASARSVLELSMVAERVVAAGLRPFAVDEAAPAVVVELHVGLSHVGRERGDTELDVEGVLSRSACAHVDRSAGGVFVGGLAGAELVGVVEGYRLHRGERELAEVDSPVLCVGDADAVEVDADVLGAEGADVDSLEATETAVVLDLDACEVFKCVGDGGCAKGLEGSALHSLGGSYRTFVEGRDDRDLVNMLDAVETAGSAILQGRLRYGGE